MKAWNVIWLLVDSVRTDKIAGDDRDRLDFMDEFGKIAVELKNTITSAPSTVMSISSMMCGVPSYLLARNYEEFRFDTDKFLTINSLLQKQGYDCYGIFRHPSTREKFIHTINQPTKREWGPKLSHIDWWSNEDISNLALKLLKNRNKEKPIFVFHHYNCRKDDKISDIVKKHYYDLIDLGYNDSNTIFILCSDHGYPNPNRGYSPETFKKRNMSHDMLLTNDNIMIPLFIKYPGCQENLKVETLVSSIDIFPTIINLLGMDRELEKNTLIQGISLVDLIEKKNILKYENRLIRSDSRLMLQDNRVTSFSNCKFKYIFKYDNPPPEDEEFFDLETDPLEENNIIDDSSYFAIIERFRSEFKQNEEKAKKFQTDYLLQKFRSLAKGLSSSIDSLCIIGNVPFRYLEMLCKAFHSIYPSTKITLYINKKINRYPNHHVDSTLIEMIFYQKYQEIISLGGSFDLTMVPLDNKIAANTKKLLKFSKQIPSTKFLVLDYNMNCYKRKSFWYYKILAIYEKRYFIKNEPSILFFELANIIKSAIIVIKRRLGYYRIKV